MSRWAPFRTRLWPTSTSIRAFTCRWPTASVSNSGGWDDLSGHVATVKASMELSFRDVQNILKIIDEAPHLDEIDLVYGGFRLHVVRNGVGSSKPVTVTAAHEILPDKAAPAV